MNKFKCVFFVLAAFLIIFTSVSAEDPLGIHLHNYEGEPFSDRVGQSVDLYFSVTNPDGTPVTDLTEGNFTLREDNEAKEICSVMIDNTAPVSLVMLMENSRTLTEYLPDLTTSAGRFLEGMRAKDRTAIIRFNETAAVVQDFSSNHSLAVANIKNITAEDKPVSCVYNAVFQALTMLEAQEPGHRVIVLVTDGQDEASSAGASCSAHSREEIEKLAAADDIPVYVIHFGSSPDGQELGSLAGSTNGYYFSATGVSEVSSAFGLLDRQMVSEYKLTYASGSTGGNRNVTLEVRKDGAYGQQTKLLRLKETPIIMSFRSPAAGDSLQGKVSLSVEFLELNEKISSVKYSLNGQVFGESVSYPFEYTWDTTGAAPAENAALEAICVDKNGGILARTSISVNITEAGAAEISFISPEEGSSHRGSIDLSISLPETVQDLAKVEYSAGGIVLGQSDTPPFSCHLDISQLPAGELTITASAYGKNGQEAARGSRNFIIESVPEPPAPPAKKSNVPLFIGIGAAVIIAGAAAFLILRKKEEAPNTIPAYPAPKEREERTIFERREPKPDDTPSFKTLEITRCEDQTELGKVFSIDHLPFTLGRSDDNDARISTREISVSRHHAMIDEKDGFIVIQDVGSKYGTFVNNRNIQNEPFRIKSEDIINLGRSVALKYVESSFNDQGRKDDDPSETRIGFQLSNATLMVDTNRRKIIK